MKAEAGKQAPRRARMHHLKSKAKDENDAAKAIQASIRRRKKRGRAKARAGAQRSRAARHGAAAKLGGRAGRRAGASQGTAMDAEYRKRAVAKRQTKRRMMKEEAEAQQRREEDAARVIQERVRAFQDAQYEQKYGRPPPNRNKPKKKTKAAKAKAKAAAAAKAEEAQEELTAESINQFGKMFVREVSPVPGDGATGSVGFKPVVEG